MGTRRSVLLVRSRYRHPPFLRSACARALYSFLGCFGLGAKNDLMSRVP